MGYYKKADYYYQKAIVIFEKNTIPVGQAKRQELEDEYVQFKENLKAKFD